MRVRRVVAIAVVAGSACVAGLSTREQEVVTTDITSYNFGTLPVGQGCNSPTITVSPQTQTDDDYVNTIDFTSLCPDFTLNLSGPLPTRIWCEGSGGASLTAGSGTVGCIPHIYPFTATFKPSFPGMQSCNVRIAYTGSGGSGAAFVMLSGSGMSTANSWTVSPLGLGFGDVPVSTTSSPQQVTVTNTGTQALTYQGSNSDTIVFGVGGPPLTQHTLGAGSAETFQVVCTPNIATTFNDTLTFSGSNVPTQTVTMGCRGIVTSLAVAPNPAVFAPTLVGRAPADKPVNITNNGTASVTISNFRLGTGASADLSIASNPGTTTLLPGGGSAQLVLHFAATQANAGSLGTVVFDTGASSQNIAVSGDAQVGSIGTNPASLEFGPACVGQTFQKTVTMFANAPGTVTVSSVTPPSSSQLSATAASGMLQGNHANELSVTATLMATTPATIDDKFTINSNIPMQPSLDVAIHGTVLPAGVAATPGVAHFGPVMLGTTTTAKEIVISNCGTGALPIMGASIAGANASEFTIVSPAMPPQMLLAGESMTFLVVMSPHDAGMKSAQLVITHAQGMTAADLDGTGYGGTDGSGNKDRETYYACSTGGGNGAGIWPLAIVLAVLALRRRRK